MRKTLIGTLTATIVAFSGAGLAHATPATASAPAAAVFQAQDEITDKDHDSDKTGLWGLLGLVGLLGLAGLKRRDTPTRPTTPPQPPTY